MSIEKPVPFPNNGETPMHRMIRDNIENQRVVRVSVGLLKAAINEISAQVLVNGKGVMTDMTLNALRAAAGITVKGDSE